MAFTALLARVVQMVGNFMAMACKILFCKPMLVSIGARLMVDIAKASRICSK